MCSVLVTKDCESLRSGFGTLSRQQKLKDRQ